MAFLLLRTAVPAFATALFLLSLAAPPRALAQGPRDGTWRQLPPTSFQQPSRICFDPSTRRVLSLEYARYGMTLWSFDLGAAAWSVRRNVPELGNRQIHALLVDSASHRLLAVTSEYAFNGPEDEPFEVHTLDLDDPTAWVELPIAGPPLRAREASAITFDGARNRVLVVGGHERYVNGIYGDIWQLSLTGTPAWSEIVPSGPGLRGHVRGQAFVDEAQERLVVVGGEDSVWTGSGEIFEAHAIDLAGDRSWRQLGAADSLRYISSEYPVTYDPGSQSVLLLMGQVSGESNPDSSSIRALRTTGGGTWSRLPLAGTLRTRATSQFRIFADPAQRGLVFVAGSGSNEPSQPITYHSDIWSLPLDPPRSWARLYDSVNPQWVRPSWPMVLDEAGRRVLSLHGSMAPMTYEFLLADQTRWHPIPATGPGPLERAGAVAAYDAAGSRAVLFGGGMRGLEVGDLWEVSYAFVPSRWRRLLPEGEVPGPRLGAAAIFDPVRRRMVMFGGFAGRPLDETWALDLAGAEPAWHRVQTRGIAPAARFWHSAVYDSRRDGMIIHGGATGDRDNTGSLGDTWFLSFADCDAWVPLGGAVGVAGRRYSHGAVYDPIGDRMIVLWGRDVAGQRTTMWMLRLGAAPQWDSFFPQGARAEERLNPFVAYDGSEDRLVVIGGGFDSEFANLFDAWAIAWQRSATPPPADDTAGAFRILAVGPNPSRGDVNIAFELPRATTVATRLYDVRGRMVRDLGMTLYQPGPHILCWDGRAATGERLRDGVYFARIVVEGKAISGKIVLMD